MSHFQDEMRDINILMIASQSRSNSSPLCLTLERDDAFLLFLDESVQQRSELRLLLFPQLWKALLSITSGGPGGLFFEDLDLDLDGVGLGAAKTVARPTLKRAMTVENFIVERVSISKRGLRRLDEWR